jgi:SAM-dependent methyltransferase
MIDRPGTDPALIREELNTLEDMNRRLGGYHLIFHHVRRFLPSNPGTPVRILDLGTGNADIPRALVQWTRKRGVSVSITAVDGNSDVLEIAQEACRGSPEIQLEQHDLRRLPYGPNSYDLVLCSLALHHFGWADAVMILRRIGEVARTGYLVNDLRRNWASIWISALVIRLMTRSTIVRQDGPQSCRAAFTVGELRAAAGEAGLRNYRIVRRHGIFRMVLEGAK